MDTSLNWLNRHLETPVTADQADHALTAAGFPIEERNDLPDGDVFLDVEVTSNRGDCLSHYGLAREVAAQLGLGLKPLAPPSLAETAGPVADALKLENREPGVCPRFTARVLKGVKVGPSPAWLVQLLEAVGQRSINNVVDVTNFITHELGHPCHVFDLAKLAGGTLIVRYANKGEKLRTLDEKDRELRETDLVVADAERATSLAGVIGGGDSEVSDATTDVVFEMATWDPVTVRHARRGHNVSTDAAYRFERGVSPLEIPAAADLAVAMILELAGGQLCEGVLDEGAPLPEHIQLTLRPGRCRDLTGLDISDAEITDLLARLGMDPKPAADAIACTVPAFRGDLTREIDLIEEIARTRGLDAVPSPETLPVRVKSLQPTERATRAIGEAMTGCGFYETVTFSFTSPAHAALFTPKGVQTVAVADDRRKAEPTLRPSTLTGLLGCRKQNQDGRVEVSGGIRLFELAAVYGETAPGDSIERRTLSLLADAPGSGAKRSDDEKQLAVRVVRGAVESVVAACFGSSAEVQVRPAEAGTPGWDAHAFGIVSVNGTDIGCLGLVSQAALDAFGLDIPAAAAEIDLEPLRAAFPPASSAHALPAFPPIERDLSLVVDEQTPYGSLAELITGAELERLDGFAYVGAFRGKQVGAGKKSLTVRLRFRDDTRTLRHEEVDPEVETIVKAAQSTIGAELRA